MLMFMLLSPTHMFISGSDDMVCFVSYDMDFNDPMLDWFQESG